MKKTIGGVSPHTIKAIVVFYVIALAVRFMTLFIADKYPTVMGNYFFLLSTGVGPLIGAIVAMIIFKRKTQSTLIGKSLWKSIVTIAVPCIVFGILGGTEMGGLCLFAFAYSLLEEYGWRGFLQNELKGLPMWLYVPIITIMWFLWHLNFYQQDMLPFFLMLLLASFIIGKAVNDTHSLLLCAALHGAINFKILGLLPDTTFIIALICIILFWIVLWYFVKPSLLKTNN
jgi:membrane protease YdiL (CAAX protease family)